jgi:hypothetical protein
VTRTNQALLIVALLTVAGPARGSEKEAKEILQRAIKAHGGERTLTKAAQLRRRDVGTQTLPSGLVKFTIELVRSLPDRFRLTAEVGRIKTTIVFNGDKAWQSDGGPAVEQQQAHVQELREEAYVDWIITLVPLTRTGFTLSTLPKTKVGGEAAVGIKVVRKGSPEVRLYFLESSGLLARAEREAREVGLKVDKEYLYSAYKEFDGVKLPTKQVVLINGRKFTEFTSSDVSFPARLPEKTFAKP